VKDALLSESCNLKKRDISGENGHLKKNFSRSGEIFPEASKHKGCKII
jgi:hypothetical protein